MGVRSYLERIFAEPRREYWSPALVTAERKPCASCGVEQGLLHLPGCTAAPPVGSAPELPAFEQRVPRPRLAVVSRAPSREEFDAWRDHPVTQFVFAGLRAAARAQKEAWADSSWEQGISSEILLNELRVRADAYSSLEEGGYEAFCEWAGVEPEPEG